MYKRQLLHFEAGDGGFLEAFHAARPGWELSAIESGDAFMRLLKKAFLRSAYNADYRDADIASRFHIIAVTKPLDEVEKPLNAVQMCIRDSLWRCPLGRARLEHRAAGPCHTSRGSRVRRLPAHRRPEFVPPLEKAIVHLEHFLFTLPYFKGH